MGYDGITYATGDATAPDTSDGRPAVIAHICNDVGAWGAGFVVPLAARWPAARDQYLAWREAGRWVDPDGEEHLFMLGMVQFVDVGGGVTVANMIAQTGLGRPRLAVPPLRYNALGKCLAKVGAHAARNGARVHMPRIGTGLAGGTWTRIGSLIVERLPVGGDGGVPVTVYDLP